jgi:hypothetical protein
MVNRVWIEPSVLRVSKPGVEVTVAGNDGLLFNGDWASASKLFKGSVLGSVGGGTVNHNVNFPKVFSSTPFLLASMTDRDTGITFQFGGFGGGSSNIHNPKVGVDLIVIQTTVSTAGASFAIRTTASANTNYTINWMVFDFRMGTGL